MNPSSECCDGCADSARDDTTVAVACTLGPDDFKTRVAALHELASRSLRRSRRDGLVLDLTYDAAELPEIENLVAKERECCAFLEFRLRLDAEGVRLTITAPQNAGPAADDLFAHFAPELAKDAA